MTPNQAAEAALALSTPYDLDKILSQDTATIGKVMLHHIASAVLLLALGNAKEAHAHAEPARIASTIATLWKTFVDLGIVEPCMAPALVIQNNVAGLAVMHREHAEPACKTTHLH